MDESYHRVTPNEATPLAGRGIAIDVLTEARGLRALKLGA
jgi:hypothetical protein